LSQLSSTTLSCLCDALKQFMDPENRESFVCKSPEGSQPVFGEPEGESTLEMLVALGAQTGRCMDVCEATCLWLNLPRPRHGHLGMWDIGSGDGDSGLQTIPAWKSETCLRPPSWYCLEARVAIPRPYIPYS
jgi:hypothetical protein